MPLKVIIVGAGIAGLTAAIALRKAGHRVLILEKSAFATETGAALTVCPNGTRVLNHLDFSFSAARAVEPTGINMVDGRTLENLGGEDLTAAEQQFGAKMWFVHRVDLHRELLRLATQEDGVGIPVELRLSCEIVGARVEGEVLLTSGEVHRGDLVVAADGLKSVLREIVCKDAGPPTATGISAFRFLLDTEVVRGDKALEAVMEKKGARQLGMLGDGGDSEGKRFVIWYECRDGKTQNFAGIHPTREVNGNDQEEVKAAMLDEFKHFAPEMLEFIRRSTAAKCWPLFAHEPLSTWYNNRIVLIGDSVHPMLPFNAQGANIAMEDGGALGYLFQGIDDASAVTERLEIFQSVRRDRAARVQLLCNVKLGREKQVEEQVRPYADPKGSSVPTNMHEHIAHDYGHDVFEKCDEVLSACLNSNIPAPVPKTVFEAGLPKGQVKV